MFTEKEILEFLNSFSGTNKDLKHFTGARVLENHLTEEQLKEKISWLRSELNLKTLELANKERYYTDKLENLGQKVEKLKEDRKHLLQDKNAVINLTKAFLDDTIDHTTYEVYGLLQNYYKKLTEINLGSNDSNTKTYLELKHSRDHYKRLVDILKRKSKEEIDTREDIILQISEQNQKLVNEVNRLKEEMEDLEERNILAFKALRLQTKGK
nr:MAG TPA: hypothetical protein [Caudoviricetes sp.]